MNATTRRLAVQIGDTLLKLFVVLFCLAAAWGVLVGASFFCFSAFWMGVRLTLRFFK